MRVAILDGTSVIQRPASSGLSDVCWDLGRTLAAQGEEVHIVGAYDASDPSPPGEVRLRRIDRPRLWRRNIVGHILTGVAITRAIGRIPRPDVVYAPEYFYASIAARLRPDLPVVFQTTGNIYERIANGNPFDWSTTQVYKVAARTAARRCARVIAISRYMREWWIRTGAAPERVPVVPLGVDLSLYHPVDGARRRLGIAAEEETVVYVGRLSVEKNLSVVVRAVAALGRERPALRLRLIGQGAEEERLRTLVRELEAEQAVLFIPWVAREQVPDYYRAADAMVLPSTSEPLARVLLEALACGTLVVASNATGNPDIVRDGVNGLLVDPRDVEGWRCALASVFEQPDRRARMAVAGRRTAEEEVAWPVVARRMRDEVFGPVVGERRG